MVARSFMILKIRKPKNNLCFKNQLENPLSKYLYSKHKIKTSKMKKFLLFQLALILSCSIYSQTSGSFTDSRDGKRYKTIKIGNQVWMAENLNYNTSSGSWCYENSTSNCDKYGKLYNWETAKKVCPAGWHLPSDVEWSQLVKYLGGWKDAAMKLKSKTGWSDNGNGINSTGFNALPGGYFIPSSENYGGGDKYGNLGLYGNWWEDLEYGSSSAYAVYIGYSKKDEMNGWNYNGKSGFSVRCIKD